MAAGGVVFDGAAATLTDDAARTLYGIAADAGGRAGTNVAAGSASAGRRAGRPVACKAAGSPFSRPYPIYQEVTMFNRRELLFAGAGFFTPARPVPPTGRPIPELTFAVVPAENASVSATATCFTEYLSKELGVP